MNPALLLAALVALAAAFAAVAPIFSPARRLRETGRVFPGQHKYWLPRSHTEPSRRTLFTPDVRYRIRRGIAQGQTRFIDGEVVTFRRADYSRRDCAFVYCFAHNDGHAGDWWLPDSEPCEIAERYFEALL